MAGIFDSEVLQLPSELKAEQSKLTTHTIGNQQKVSPHCKKYSAHTLIHTIIDTMHFISSIEYVVIKNDQFYFSIQVYKKKKERW